MVPRKWMESVRPPASLKAQRKEAEAQEIAGRFEKAWTHADVTLAASRF